MDLQSLNSISSKWLKSEIPIYYIWWITSILGVFVSCLLLKYLPKWKIYNEQLMLLFKSLLVNSMALQMATSMLAIFHVYNIQFEVYEAIAPKKCYLFAGFVATLGRISSWIILLISIDRYVAFVKPSTYENRF